MATAEKAVHVSYYSSAMTHMSHSSRASASETSPLVTTSGKGLRGVGSGLVCFRTLKWIPVFAWVSLFLLRFRWEGPSPSVFAPFSEGRDTSDRSLADKSPLLFAKAAAWSAAFANVCKAWMGAPIEAEGTAASDDSDSIEDALEDRDTLLGEGGAVDTGMIP